MKRVQRLNDRFDESVSGDASWFTVGHAPIEISEHVNFFPKKCHGTKCVGESD